MLSYLECFKPISRLEGTLGAKIELEIDLTFSLLIIAIQEFFGKQRVYAFPASSTLLREVGRLILGTFRA